MTEVMRLCVCNALDTIDIVLAEASMPLSDSLARDAPTRTSSYTRLDHIYANVAHTSLDLFLDELRGNLVNTVDTESVLCS